MTTPVLPPPSYPGTRKVFTTKNDGDVIYGEHANEIQEEIVAIEGAVGLNPEEDYQGQLYLSMSDRLAHLEEDTVRLEGNQLIRGTKEFVDTLQVDGNLIANGAPARFKYADRQFLLSDAGMQQYMADGTTARDLLLQPNGAQVYRGGYRMWDAGNDGAGSGLDADTVDGHQASDFLLASGAEAIATHTQTIHNGTNSGYGAGGWQDLVFDTVTFQDNSFGTVYPGDGWFHIVIDGVYIVTVSVTWSPGINQSLAGWRALHIRDSTGLWLGHEANPVPDLAMYSSGAPQELTRGRYLTAGTKIKAAAWQSSGANLDITTTTLPKPVGSNAAAYPTGMVVAKVV